MNHIQVAVGALLLGTSLYYLCGIISIHLRHRRNTQKLIDDFNKKYPGRCCLCSYYRYRCELTNSLTVMNPVPHECPEKK